MGLAGLAEDVGGNDLALVFADMGEQPHSRDVADAPQPRSGAQVRVDPDTVLVDRGAGCFQADPAGARAAAGGHQQVVAAQLAAVIQRQHKVRAVAPRGGRVRAQVQLGAVGAQDLP